ncbi:UNVERIFIED_CONTAM: hypothetical protein Sradi_1585000 [Sesamum radiatum]|uniref:DUF4283 domain-containing protein n=1 Tax=Sesamum radiatum TaxID=300843 RepID=A0AAW2U9L0_SESRA
MESGMGNHDQEMEPTRAEILRGSTPLEVGSSSAPAPSAAATPLQAGSSSVHDQLSNVPPPTPSLALRKHGYTQVPIWVKLKHIPVVLWTTDGLSTIVSGIGRLLYTDPITKAGTRLDFARVCVMVDFNATLPKYIVMMFSGEDGNEQPYRVDVEYEWISSKCLTCRSLGHTTAGCPSTKKPAKPPVAVYVPKPPSRIPKEPNAGYDPPTPSMRLVG